jgi:hypothetical protein
MPRLAFVRRVSGPGGWYERSIHASGRSNLKRSRSDVELSQGAAKVDTAANSIISSIYRYAGKRKGPIALTDATTALKAPPPSFAALRHSGFRPYLIGNALVMMADSVEHVISYWVMYQKFHSPALAGFAVISHWVPFLVFGVWVGALSDRFDPRRVIQIGMVLFMMCSLTWAMLFHLGLLAEWQAPPCQQQ